jgi:hypothetical protein
MKMDIQVQCATKTLDQHYCPGRALLERISGLVDEVGRNRPINDSVVFVGGVTKGMPIHRGGLSLPRDSIRIHSSGRSVDATDSGVCSAVAEHLKWSGLLNPRITEQEQASRCIARHRGVAVQLW